MDVCIVIRHYEQYEPLSHQSYFFVQENDKTGENYVSTENAPGPKKSKEKRERKSTWIWIYDNHARWDIEMVVCPGMADESNKS